MFTTYITITQFLEKHVLQFLLLLMRIWMAQVFWYSGLTKISSWPATIFLFKEEYKTPFIQPEFAAYIATITELTCPILLVLGLGVRFATIPMLVMTAVIQFSYLDLIDHRYWAMILSLLLCYGAGTISLDYLIKRRWFGW